MPGPTRRVAALGLAVMVAGCAASDRVDGWILGELLERCADRAGELPCGGWLDTAFAARGARAPAGWTVDLHLAVLDEADMRADRMVVVVVGRGPMPWERWAVGLSCPAGDALDCTAVQPPAPR